MQLTNPYSWLLIFNALIALALIPFAWRRRSAPGARPFLLMLIGVTIWTTSSAFEYLNTQPEGMFFWVRFQYVGIVVTITAWVLFVLEYTGRENLLRYRWVLWIEPVLVLLLAFTNERHGLIIKSYELVTANGWVFKNPTHNTPFYLHAAYSYLLLLAVTILMLRALIRSPQLYRGQAGFLLVAVVTPWVSNVVFLFARPPIDPTPLAFSITTFSLALSFFRFRLFNVVPIAHDWLVDHMGDAVIVLDSQNQVIEANRAAIQLLTGDDQATTEFVGSPAAATFGRLWAPVQHCLDEEQMIGEINAGTELEPRWFELRVSPLLFRPGPLPIGRNLGRLLVFHNIQERIEAAELMAEARDQALQASLLKSQVIANVSHELRTPLNAIVGYGEMLLADDEAPLPARQAEKVRRMVNAAQQVSLFVSDLLDQALIEKGKLTLYPSVFQVNEFVAGLQGLFEEAARQKGLQFEILLAPSFPETLFGDVKRLQQTLINLVGNAIKFTDHGSVTVRLKCLPDERWAMEVEDTGIGITLEAQSLIFEPFQQVSAGGRQNRGGAGLGLAITRQLVTMMGGHIDLESQPGCGSRFIVILPLLLQSQAAVGETYG